MESLDLVVNATCSQVEDFKESILWADIVRELNVWTEGFKRELESIVENSAEGNPSTATVLMHMGDINGRMKAVDYVLSIPDVFIDVINQQKEDKDAERTERENRREE